MPHQYEFANPKKANHCTCLEENAVGDIKSSKSGCLVHGTIRHFILERFYKKYYTCKYCGMLMSGPREDSFYKGKWFDQISCEDPDCGRDSRHVCKWWLDKDGNLKQEYIDKEIQRRKDNNLPMGAGL